MFLQVCNAVVVAKLLNATLVIPRFLYSSVWKDKRLVITDAMHFTAQYKGKHIRLDFFLLLWTAINNHQLLD